MKDIALITGCYGQDGSYLVEQLTEKGYEVHGICRRKLSYNSKCIREELRSGGVFVMEHHDSLYDYESIRNLIGELKPSLLFHTAAKHYSSEKHQNNETLENKKLFDDNVLATSNILCACQEASDKTRVMISGSCLMFDASGTHLQNENTPYKTCSLYGMAKITETELARYYRNEGLFVSVAILYNHESHRRSETFVTKKIATGLMGIKDGKRKELLLGDIETKKDWGFAGDYTEGMYQILMAGEPDDYVLATGTMYTIRDYIEECVKQLGIDNWEKFVTYDEKIVTRHVNGELCGDSTKAKKELGWEPKYGITELVGEMLTGGAKS